MGTTTAFQILIIEPDPFTAYQVHRRLSELLPAKNNIRILPEAPATTSEYDLVITDHRHPLHTTNQGAPAMLALIHSGPSQPEKGIYALEDLSHEVLILLMEDRDNVGDPTESHSDRPGSWNEDMDLVLDQRNRIISYHPELPGTLGMDQGQLDSMPFLDLVVPRLHNSAKWYLSTLDSDELLKLRIEFKTSDGGSRRVLLSGHTVEDRKLLTIKPTGSSSKQKSPGFQLEPRGWIGVRFHGRGDFEIDGGAPSDLAQTLIEVLRYPEKYVHPCDRALMSCIENGTEDEAWVRLKTREQFEYWSFIREKAAEKDEHIYQVRPSHAHGAMMLQAKLLLSMNPSSKPAGSREAFHQFCQGVFRLIGASRVTLWLCAPNGSRVPLLENTPQPPQKSIAHHTNTFELSLGSHRFELEIAPLPGIMWGKGLEIKILNAVRGNIEQYLADSLAVQTNQAGQEGLTAVLLRNSDKDIILGRIQTRETTLSIDGPLANQIQRQLPGLMKTSPSQTGVVELMHPDLGTRSYRIHLQQIDEREFNLTGTDVTHEEQLREGLIESQTWSIFSDDMFKATGCSNDPEELLTRMLSSTCRRFHWIDSLIFKDHDTQFSGVKKTQSHLPHVARGGKCDGLVEDPVRFIQRTDPDCSDLQAISLMSGNVQMVFAFEQDHAPRHVDQVLQRLTNCLTDVWTQFLKSNWDNRLLGHDNSTSSTLVNHLGLVVSDDGETTFSYSSTLPEASEEEFKRTLEKSLESRRPQRLEFERRNKLKEIAIYPVTERFALCVKRDLTTDVWKQRLSELRKQALGLSPDGIFMFNVDTGRILYANPRMTEFTNMDLDELLEMSVEIKGRKIHFPFLPNEFRNNELDLESLKIGKFQRSKVSIRAENNPLAKHSWSISLAKMSGLKSSDHVFAMGILRDNTQSGRKRTVLINEVIGFQEQERKELSYALHDHLGQKLSALNMFLEAMSDKELGTDDKLRPIKDLAKEAMNDARILSKHLMPHTLSSLGIAICLRELVEELSRLHGIPTYEFHEDLGERRFSPDMEIHLYRLTQYLLKYLISNRVKYLSVRCSVNNGMIVIELVGKDSTKAMNPMAQDERTKVRHRLNAIGATLEETMGKNYCSFKARALTE